MSAKRTVTPMATADRRLRPGAAAHPGETPALACSRRRDCHSAEAPSIPLLKHPLNGSYSRKTVSGETVILLTPPEFTKNPHYLGSLRRKSEKEKREARGAKA